MHNIFGLSVLVLIWFITVARLLIFLSLFYFKLNFIKYISFLFNRLFLPFNNITIWTLLDIVSHMLNVIIFAITKSRKYYFWYFIFILFSLCFWPILTQLLSIRILSITISNISCFTDSNYGTNIMLYDHIPKITLGIFKRSLS